MPQKTRSQKERAAARRETGQLPRPIAPAPIELEAPETDSGFNLRVPGAPVRRTTTTAVALPHSAEGEFNYSYVYADLRRIGLLAALCLGIMIALSFVLH